MTIQSETEEKKVLELIVAASEEFLQSAGSEFNYQKITDTILYISGAKYAAFDLYDEDGSKFRTLALSGPDVIIKKISSLIGFNLLGKVWENEPARAEKIKSYAITHITTVSEYAGDLVAKPAAFLVEKALNLGELVILKILKDNLIIGKFILVMPKNVNFRNENYIELYTRQLGLLITRSRSEAKLRESEMQLRNVFSAVADPLFLLDQKTGAILDINAAACSLYGYTRDEMLKLKDIDMSAEPDKTKKATKEFKDIAVIPVRYHRKKDGSKFPVEITASIVDLSGRKVIAASMRDITKRKLSEDILLASEERYRVISDESPIAIERYNELGALLDVNPACLKLFGVSDIKEIQNFNLFADPNISDENRKMTKQGKAVRYQGLFDFEKVKELKLYHTSKSGSIWIDVIITPLKNNEGSINGYLLHISDITEQKKAEEEILHLSFHDHLTGLYNRRFFEEELKRLDTERQLPLSFIMGDLNGLKIINDVFGHDEGDKLLKEVAEILKTVCRSEDMLARWGGDEFVILLPKTSAADAEDIVDRIKAECGKTSGQKIPASLSLGAATKEKAGQDIQSIVIDAESNMYKNKLAQKESLTRSIIFALERALYEKSSETKEHTDRIHEFALKLGKSVKLSSSQLDEISLLASLHDIGKVAIPETILLKKGKLTEKEWNIIRRHPEIGFNIAQSSPQIAHIAKSILSCHENWDGSGYPLGLKGHAIPVISRIILIIDAYDVMTTGRIYKPAMSKEDAIAELKRCAGTQFDPELVDKFLDILKQ